MAIRSIIAANSAVAFKLLAWAQKSLPNPMSLVCCQFLVQAGQHLGYPHRVDQNSACGEIRPIEVYEFAF
jgi:hypothetical protein